MAKKKRCAACVKTHVLKDSVMWIPKPAPADGYEDVYCPTCGHKACVGKRATAWDCPVCGVHLRRTLLPDVAPKKLADLCPNCLRALTGGWCDKCGCLVMVFKPKAKRGAQVEAIPREKRKTKLRPRG